MPAYGKENHMNISCLLGKHDWDKCKCTKCSKIRDQDHDWSEDCECCNHCGAIRKDAHQWDGCKCKNCGKTRDSEHDWSKDCEQCSRCGGIRKDAHQWDGCKCNNCGHTKQPGLIELHVLKNNANILNLLGRSMGDNPPRLRQVLNGVRTVGMGAYKDILPLLGTVLTVGGQSVKFAPGWGRELHTKFDACRTGFSETVSITFTVFEAWGVAVALINYSALILMSLTVADGSSPETSALKKRVQDLSRLADDLVMAIDRQGISELDLQLNWLEEKFNES